MPVLERLRVLLVDMPRLVCDMIERAVRAQPDMVVVDVVGQVQELVDAVDRTQPHLVVVGLKNGGLPPECDDALSGQPGLKVLGIESEVGSALLYELTSRRQAIGTVSPADVVQAIRAAGSRRLFPLQEH